VIACVRACICAHRFPFSPPQRETTYRSISAIVWPYLQLTAARNAVRVCLACVGTHLRACVCVCARALVSICVCPTAVLRACACACVCEYSGVQVGLELDAGKAEAQRILERLDPTLQYSGYSQGYSPFLQYSGYSRFTVARASERIIPTDGADTYR